MHIHDDGQRRQSDVQEIRMKDITLFKIPHAALMHVCIYMYLQECVGLATLLTVSPAQTYNFVRHKLMLLRADKVCVG